MTISGEYYRNVVSGQARGLGPECLRWGLWAASFPYGAAISVRNWLYDRGLRRVTRAGVPVISVGNLTLGGTGKTPCVEYIARFYRRLDLRVAILSRGYGSEQGRNDEALVLEENLPDVPHLQGVDRVALAALAVEELESEVLLLDDGFQHRRLARDLDVVLIDVTDPLGLRFGFPRGLLRESPRGLKRAGVVLLTRCDQAPEMVRRLHEAVRRYSPMIPIVETTHRPVDLVNGDGGTADLDRLRSRPVAAFCGLGNPQAFRRTLQDIGATVRAFRVFPDHHPYSRQDVEDLRTWASQQTVEAVVTTQKDMVKLRLSQLGGRDLWALRIGLEVQAGQEALEEKLLAAIGK